MDTQESINKQYVDLQHGLTGALDTVIWRSSARIIEILLEDKLIDSHNFHVQEKQLGVFGVMLLLKKKNIAVQPLIILSSRGDPYEESADQKRFFQKGYELMEQLNYQAIRLGTELSHTEATEYASNLEKNLYQEGSEQNRLFYRLKKIDLNLTGRTR